MHTLLRPCDLFALGSMSEAVRHMIRLRKHHKQFSKLKLFFLSPTLKLNFSIAEGKTACFWDSFDPRDCAVLLLLLPVVS